MPASSLFGDMDHHGGVGVGGMSMSHSHSHMHHLSTPVSSSANTSCSSGIGGSGSLIDDDQRALQLALELSMLGLSDGGSLASLHQLAASVGGGNDNHGGGGHSLHNMMHHHQQQQHHLQQQQQQHQQQMHHNQLQNSDSDIYGMVNGSDGLLPKKSQNMTECVPVPSSEHVAEIVGRQGCKIKALRAKTNTYIKTPVRGEEPVFVVTGRKEDVAAAKREILSAADHFSQIRASRKGGVGVGPAAPAPVPGQITIQVRVPYRVVGLVVGPKGATIKRIQQQTHTYIVTPSREKDPVFEVTGLPDNVQVAKREIESHIAIRTGSFPLDQNQMMDGGDLSNPVDILATLYKNGIGSLGNMGLEGLGFVGSQLSQLGAINSLSSSLSSVSGNHIGHGGHHGGVGAPRAQNGNSVGSSSSGGGSLSSLNSLNGGFSAKMGTGNHGAQSSADSGFFAHQALSDLTFSLMDNTATPAISSSRSEDSYLFGGSGPNSIEDGSNSQNKLTDIFASGPNNSVGSSLWGSFDRDEGLGESPTLETAPAPSNLISLQ